MKRNRLNVSALGIAVFLLALSGCASVVTDKGVYSPDVPPEQSCTLEMRGLVVNAFNGSPVLWAPDSLFSKTTKVVIPAGQHTFAGYYSYTVSRQGGFSSVINKDFSNTQNCLPGHTYRVYLKTTWIIVWTIRKVKIKDITPKNVLAELGA
jgi:hypothetical protein